MARRAPSEARMCPAVPPHIKPMVATATVMSRRCRPSSLEALATDVIVAQVLPVLEGAVAPEGADALAAAGKNPFVACKPAIIETLIEKIQRKRGHLNLSCVQFEILFCRSGVKKLDLFLTSEFLARKDALR
ncbi:hypothetical protein V5799_004634 [Amblyomma americanum]|uniref:Uncharacterized protein n=1 Tax=Amblyomma americanum TaxID=6943 RepID=A0AAQ4D5J0_AMBAM